MRETRRTSSNLQRSFFRSVFLAMGIMIILVFLITAYVMRMLVSNTVQATFHTNLLQMAQQEAQVRRDPQGFVSDYHELFAGVGREVRVTILDAEGKVVADSGLPTQGIIPMRPGRDLSTAVDVQEAQADSWGIEPLRRGLFGLSPDQTASYAEGDYIYRLSFTGASLTQVRNALLGSLLLSVALALVISLALALHMGVRFSFPVVKLKEQAQRLARGDFSGGNLPEPDPRRNYTSELTELAEAFRMMQDRLERAYAELNQSNETLTGILQSINDGVVAVDSEGQVMLLTDRVEDYLGEMSFPDTPRPGVTGDPERTLSLLGTNYSHVSRILEQAMEENERISETLVLPGLQPQVLEVNAAPLNTSRQDGAVAVIQDSTRVKQLERMRRDFVANVTHELKTPLTSIRGYIDLLRARPRDHETTAQFYDIIEIEAARLQSLINDMLALSEIESGLEVQRERVTLYQVADEVMSQVGPLLEKHEVSLELDLDPDLQISAEYDRVRQMLTNLLTNAIVYNRPGGSVWLRAEIERDMAIIQVQDTGIGIPEQAQGRLFERFYRVSPDRSREAGGTGLGLSIVKHIVASLGGTIEVTSVEGVGTTFTIRIPQPRERM